MNSSYLVIGLAMITLVIVLTYAVISRIGVEKSKKEHHHSAITEDAPRQRNG